MFRDGVEIFVFLFLSTHVQTYKNSSYGLQHYVDKVVAVRHEGNK